MHIIGADVYYKLHLNFTHIGDQVATTPIPENIFNSTGKKCVVTDPNIWVFKHNPYVIHMSEDQAKEYPTLSLIPDCRIADQQKNYVDKMQAITAGSQAEFMCLNFGMAADQISLRHPRLYVHEEEKIDPLKIVVHTTGSDRTRDNEPAIRFPSGEDAVRIMSDEVIDAILNNYQDYKIVQVGSIDDKPLGGHSIDRRGQYDYWQTAEEIATAAKFIGVNSGPMHIANCYPRVEKKIVLMEFPPETLLKYKPGDVRNWLFSWIDPANTYYNKTDHDVGITYSYKKI